MSAIRFCGPRDYTATEHRPDGPYVVTIQADSWDHAGRVCRKRGLTLDGKLYATGEGLTDGEANGIIKLLAEMDRMTA